MVSIRVSSVLIITSAFHSYGLRQILCRKQALYVYLYCVGVTASWQPYVKNYTPNPSFDHGNRAAALWLDQ